MASDITVFKLLLEEIPHLAGNLLQDAHRAILIQEHGIRQFLLEIPVFTFSVFAINRSPPNLTFDQPRDGDELMAPSPDTLGRRSGAPTYSVVVELRLCAG